MFGLANITNTVAANTFNYFPDFLDNVLHFTVTGKTDYAVSLTDSVTATISHEIQYLLSVKNDRVLCKLLSELEFFNYFQHVSEKNRQWSTTAWLYQNRNKFKTVWSGRLMVIPLKWYIV